MPLHVCDASDITIAVLTGHRPELLRRTLASLPSWLIDTARLVCFHNGRDVETVQELDTYEQALRISHRSRNGEILPIGVAASLLVSHVIAIGNEHVLYLEDDWLFEGPTEDGSWLTEARSALAWPGVRLVRLRQSTEPTLKYNMVTRQKIVWKPVPDQGFSLSDHAHYTLNPTLMRTVDLPWPATGETDAQRKFAAGGGRSAQLVPGVFRHIGGDQSLRKMIKDRVRVGG